ncbi:hypothetical protein G7K_1132-t1 [Saitoella complicata NRRL Y-17804]|uniref:Uncharacterized protein n=1 Tax=Saitoella complicata (strain BCRC 22490 / CBS 7301 / JCM 7358 / NBRC 10748 / NRRL Y-17804) TaxID=698492 RepID=A0A0E9NAR5_SAICN|nr:hypothetical protein G7K_1132-t1 [Saitoella complicata NRRL Y-17804]
MSDVKLEKPNTGYLPLTRPEAPWQASIPIKPLMLGYLILLERSLHTCVHVHSLPLVQVFLVTRTLSHTDLASTTTCSVHSVPTRLKIRWVQANGMCYLRVWMSISPAPRTVGVFPSILLKTLSSSSGICYRINRDGDFNGHGWEDLLMTVDLH